MEGTRDKVVLPLQSRYLDGNGDRLKSLLEVIVSFPTRGLHPYRVPRRGISRGELHRINRPCRSSLQCYSMLHGEDEIVYRRVLHTAQLSSSLIQFEKSCVRKQISLASRTGQTLSEHSLSQGLEI